MFTSRKIKRLNSRTNDLLKLRDSTIDALINNVDCFQGACPIDRGALNFIITGYVALFGSAVKQDSFLGENVILACSTALSPVSPQQFDSLFRQYYNQAFNILKRNAQTGTSHSFLLELAEQFLTEIKWEKTSDNIGRTASLFSAVWNNACDIK